MSSYGRTGVMEGMSGGFVEENEDPLARAQHVRYLELPHTHNDGNVL